MLKREQGSVLVLVIFTIVILMMLVLGTASSMIANSKMKQSELNTEQQLYVNDACVSHTKIIIESAVNDALNKAISAGAEKTATGSGYTEDDVLNAITSAYKSSINNYYNTNNFETDLADKLNTLRYSFTGTSLQNITFDIDDSATNFCDSSYEGTTTIKYRITVASREEKFTVQLNWDMNDNLNSICNNLVFAGNNSNSISIDIKTVYK
ncbi:MAG: hypothetical protein N2171_04450 [Clostridia bacterium]|nr:hypothetical protein [Clostridia bacterium]